jgi:hypothetical protein
LFCWKDGRVNNCVFSWPNYFEKMFYRKEVTTNDSVVNECFLIVSEID